MATGGGSGGSGGSTTSWTRLEPQTRAQDLREGAAARVADPAWLLARQWQFGELHGSDGGSPAAARLRMSAGVLSGYRAHGTDPDSWSPYAQHELPLEVLVEREPRSADLSLRADGGRRFLRLLHRHGAGAYGAAFTASFPLPASSPDAPADADEEALLSVLSGRVPDGDALAAALASARADPPALPADPPVAAGDVARVVAAALQWLTWWEELVDAAPGDSGQAWDATRMEHAFALGARLGAAGTETTLVSAEYPGGTLDWYDLEVATDGTTVPSGVAGRDLVRTVLPTPVTYPGQPASRFWEFEDARVYLGGIEAGAADLGRMLLSEFAILYSDDWFLIPVELDVGTVARVESLVVTDTFGIRTLIRPAAHGDWDMFRLGAASDALFVLPPVLADAQEGGPLEEVLLLRDENANVVWGVERLVESAGGGALDRHEQYLAAVRAAAGLPVPAPLWPPDPPGDLDYRLRAGVPPEHWIPLIPELPDPAGTDGLRLALTPLGRPGSGEPIPPAGRVLGATDWLAAEEVPRDGIRVVRRWQLARGADGRTHLWRSRRKLGGRGEASSGFRHDVLARSDEEAFADSAPAIAGIAQAGRELTAVTRSWPDPAPFELAFQWRRCTAAGDACADIAGATAATFTPGTADVGATLRVTVTATATRDGATFSATSPPTDVVAPPRTAPAPLSAPLIDGRARVGETLTALPGAWSGTAPLTRSYQWRRCDATGADCSDIPGATATTYRPVPLDQGTTLRVVETVANELGRVAAASEPSAIVAAPPAAPQALQPPSIFGAPTVGRELTATTGTWSSEDPISLTQQWQRSGTEGAPDASEFSDVAGATQTSYAVATADVGRRLRIVVAAANEAGTTAAPSPPTGVVPPPPVAPVNIVAPSISGLAATGQWLVAVRGEWSQSDLRFAYQWLRCDAQGRNARPIAGATGAAYRAVSADAGATLRVEVHASNDAGSARARSAQTAPVATPPSLQAPPTISGTPEVGATLTASPGTWAASGEVTFAYRWRRCDASGGACTDIAGATSSTYSVASADLGASIRVVVTAMNAAGAASASAANTAPVRMPSPPANTVAPSVAGEPRVGRTLTAQHGVWSGSPATAWSYAWLRCDAAGATCAAIAGATARAYELTAADAGATIRVFVTAMNAVGSASATSAPTAPVAAQTPPPANKEPPAISGEPRVGEMLSADPGLWSDEVKQFAYAWLRCDAEGKDCVVIRDATERVYVPRAAAEPIPGKPSPGGDPGDPGDVGSTLRVVVTASNEAGSASAESEPTKPVQPADDPGEPPKS